VDCTAFAPGCVLGARLSTNGIDTYVFGDVFFSADLRSSFDLPHDLPAGGIVFDPVHVGDLVDVSLSNIDQYGNGLTVRVCNGNLDIGPDVDTCASVGLPPIVGLTSYSGSFAIPGPLVGDDGDAYDCTSLPFFNACFLVVFGHRDPGPSDPYVLSVAAFLDIRARSFVATPTTELQDGDVVSITVPLPRVTNDGTDCALAACVIVFNTWTTFSAEGAVPAAVSFDDSVPPPTTIAPAPPVETTTTTIVLSSPSTVAPPTTTPPTTVPTQVLGTSETNDQLALTGVDATFFAALGVSLIGTGALVGRRARSWPNR